MSRLPTAVAWCALLTLMVLAACKDAQAPAVTSTAVATTPPADSIATPALTAPPSDSAAPITPTSAGPAHTDIKGCLAAASEDDGAKFTPPVATRGGPPKPEVTFAASQGTVVVTHQLAHACCLKGKATTKVEGATILVTETVSGNHCRCRCASTLTTTVPLAAGKYTVVVLTDMQGAGAKEIAREDVEVR